MTRDPQKAIQVLDLMLEMFGGGKHWIQGREGDRRGNHCIVGALRTVRRRHHIKGDGTGLYIIATIKEKPKRRHPFDIVYYNDTRQDFPEIERVILRAREIAQAECPKIAA